MFDFDTFDHATFDDASNQVLSLQGPAWRRMAAQRIFARMPPTDSRELDDEEALMLLLS